MSLRIIVKSAQIQNWIVERGGKPARRRNTDDDLVVLFDGDKPEYETVSVDELLEAMRLNHLVMLVDQEPGKTYHKFVQHS
jgi:hypothetical protein